MVIPPKTVFIVLSSALLLGLLDLHKPNIEPEIQSPRDAITAEIHPSSLLSVSVVRVIDGDTIITGTTRDSTRVRLIGINAPETVDNEKPKQCFGDAASAYLHTLLDGRTIDLELDPSQDQYDKYGRLLAYVHRTDGVFINAKMIEDGYAYEYTYIKPYEFQKEFRALEATAHSLQRGLWSSSTCKGKL